MTTLIELKTKYQEQAAELQREYAAKEQAREDHQQEVLAETFPKVVEYLSQREGVDQDDLTKYGRIEPDWYSSGELHHVVFHLELPEHAPMYIRLYVEKGLTENTRAEWVTDNYNSYRHLGYALLQAAKMYQQEKEDYQRTAEKVIERSERKLAVATAANRRNAAKQRIFDQLANDPTALLLIKLFAQIQQDRGALDEQIDSLEQASANAEYYHGEALANVERKIKEVQREATEASDRTRSLQYEVDDLDAKLKKASRQSW
jgi:hypothetical protein